MPIIDAESLQSLQSKRSIMIKLATVLFAALIFCSCSSDSDGTSPVADNTDAPSKNSGSTDEPETFTVTDNTIKINPNNTIDTEFGDGLLPNEFLNGEKVNHNFKPAYFGYDSATIHAQEKPKLKMLAGFLESNPKLFLIIEGHCDERGSDEYNRALSERRALAVKEFIETSAPSVSGRINTIGFGEEKLEDNGTTADAHARNRRAVFVIISKR